ncbi:uncharacterized protein BKA55DRAFT_569091 [Fusarium redolens]|uniref:Uncharacterized protein n=1 Tax=Fusarium redolens TaxID=48865 RepID=A0A9P9H407_FUSRE|nr:uncharacterized protein BKA55DRAFT_569091 [Fusarium redolens]KAH7250251.1 hypothetical protein BKA55DRAFT_569091 [Fusarium redolens]
MKGPELFPHSALFTIHLFLFLLPAYELQDPDVYFKLKMANIHSKAITTMRKSSRFSQPSFRSRFSEELARKTLRRESLKSSLPEILSSYNVGGPAVTVDSSLQLMLQKLTAIGHLTPSTIPLIFYITKGRLVRQLTARIVVIDDISNTNRQRLSPLTSAIWDYGNPEVS